MLCDVCGSQKTPLFLSWVCDHCETGQPARKATHVAFVTVDPKWTAPPERLIYGVYAFQTRTDAEAVLRNQQANGYDLRHRVMTIGADRPFEWDTITFCGLTIHVTPDPIEVSRQPGPGKVWLIG